jgi:hypothetical protein
MTLDTYAHVMADRDGAERLSADARSGLRVRLRCPECVRRRRRPHHNPAKTQHFREADERIRTADPFITSEVLYQLSYVGRGGNPSRSPSAQGAVTAHEPRAPNVPAPLEMT